MGAIYPQDLKDRKPKIGEVLITPRRHFNIYSLIIKQNHFEDINEEYVKIAIHKLRIALEREHISKFRISKYGDFSDTLPKEKLWELLTQDNNMLRQRKNTPRGTPDPNYFGKSRE